MDALLLICQKIGKKRLGNMKLNQEAYREYSDNEHFKEGLRLGVPFLRVAMQWGLIALGQISGITK